MEPESKMNVSRHLLYLHIQIQVEQMAAVGPIDQRLCHQQKQQQQQRQQRQQQDAFVVVVAVAVMAVVAAKFACFIHFFGTLYFDL